MTNKRDQIYESITKKDIRNLFLAGCVIGAVIFMICYGVKILDFTNDAWLLAGGDLQQHYVGWKFFRASDWHFPLGMMDSLLYPDLMCVTFTDSIPLFALFFKVLSPILPETFQYFGLFGIITYMLMGGFSAVLIRKSTETKAICLIGSVFFVFSPYVFQRMYVHTALSANWLILMALGIWLYRPYFCTFKRKTIAWAVTLITASLIHIYYIPMVMIVMVFACFQDLLENNGWVKDILMGVIVVGADLIVLRCVGSIGAQDGGAMSGDGLGQYSANLNTFWNSYNHSFLIEQRLFIWRQDEGFGYLGLGMLILIPCVIIALIIYQILLKCRSEKFKWIADSEDEVKILDSEKKYWFQRHSFPICTGIVCLITMFLAVEPEIAFGDRTLILIEWPEKIETLLAIFRANGRFVWLISNLIMLAVISAFAKHIRKSIVLVLLSVTCVIQLADLSKFVVEKYKLTMDYPETAVMKSSEWEDAAAGKKHVVMLTYSWMLQRNMHNTIYEMANFVVDHDMTMNYYLAARVSNQLMDEKERDIIDRLENGDPALSDVLFILDSKETGKHFNLNVTQINGIYVGTVD